MTDPKTPKYQSIILLILDGWGISPSWGGNAISMNNPDIMKVYWKYYPHTILQAFKRIVGPSGKVGNSEIGHSSIGSGRIVLQDMTRIGQAIENGLFFQNPTLIEAAEHVKQHNSALHIYGLLSDGGVHSHIDHAVALADFAKQQAIDQTYFHCILDGRDAGTTTALNFVGHLENRLKENNLGHIASVVGRFYALDRDNHWERTAVAYKAFVEGSGDRYPSAEAAISAMYRKGYQDEVLPPSVIMHDGAMHTIKENDAVICFNFRADRSRQIAQLFLGEKKLGWRFSPPKNVYFAGMSTYRLHTPMNTLFPPVQIDNPLAKVLSDHGMRQLHIAESEKYAHVTYFFNGGVEDPLPGEDRVIVPSPDVVSYAETPEMSAVALTNELLKRLKSKNYQFIVANYANVDMIGHTGDIVAAIQAIATVDTQVKRVIEQALTANCAVIITADHGNAEQMVGLHKDSKTGTMHTLNPVPFILVAHDLEGNINPDAVPVSNLVADIMQTEHSLADVAPTILELFAIDKPEEMTGSSLLPLILKEK